MGALTIRTASADDSPAIRAIYAPIVENTPISFETVAPSVDEMEGRISTTLAAGHCYLIATGQDQVLGYAYSGPHRTRAAYHPSIDVSVYVATKAQRQGVGKTLYTALFDALSKTNFHMAYAGITLPNVASVALHESVGFTPVGIFSEVGWKLGRWHDVGWWQRPVHLAG
jgi:L-amino acid N-acyltransferase YncA